nr:retrovirus-related Pol polyprotein from transposon TNT 1-94 [Tanacetum cinerariifolium]
MTLETHNWSSFAHQELHKIVKDENFPIINQVDARVPNFEIQFLKEAAKFVGDFKSLAKEADESLAKHKAAYNDMQQKIEWLQAQLGDLKGKSKDTSCVSDTLNPLSQKLENENVELEFQVLNYAKENAHLKTTYKNLFDSISLTRTQTKTILASLQNELQNTIYENAKLRAKLFNKVSVQKDNKRGTSTNTKFSKQSILGKPPKLDNTKTRRPQPRSNTKNDRVPSVSKSSCNKNKGVEVEEHHRNLLLSKNKKHMSSECNNVKLATQNVKSKVVCTMCKQCLISVNRDFLGTVRFGNDHVAVILGFGDLQWGNILITRVYFVEGLGHNLFSVGQFCDSDLEVAFRRNVYFVRNLEGVDLLSGNGTTNLYTINLHDIASASPICLMARASSTKSWLWHQRLSHLNFDTINDLAKHVLVSGLQKFKYHKEHLCPSCEQEKSKRASHPPKSVPNSRQRLHLLHMDLCSPMRIASINGKRYVLVIMDDYSHYTWTLVEAARTMLIFFHAPLFLWAEAIATACFTQNRSIIHRPFNKTPYELINGGKPDISFLHVFGALCYPKNDREDIRKLGAKETMNVSFDELSAMDFEQRSSKSRLQSMTSGQISSGLDLTYAPSTITTQQTTEGELDLLFEAMYDDYIGGHPSAAPRTDSATQVHQVRQTSTTSTSIADTASIPTNLSSQATNFPISSQDVDDLNSQQQYVQQQGNQASFQHEIVDDSVPKAMFDENC